MDLKLPSDTVLMRSGKRDKILFLIHSITGATGCYKPLIPLLQGDYSVIALNAPGRSDRTARFSSFEELVESAGKRIETMLQCSKAKFSICGYSFGGVVAYETSSWLERSLRFSPQSVVLMDPFLISASPSLLEDRELWLTFANMVGCPSLERIKARNPFWNLDEDQRIRDLYENAMRVAPDRLPSGWKFKEFVEYFYFFSKLWFIPNARPKTKSGSHVLYFHTIEAERRGYKSMWCDLISKNSKIVELPGTHARLTEHPVIHDCAVQMNEFLKLE